MELTRRDVIRTLAGAPLAIAAGCACPSRYPASLIDQKMRETLPTSAPLMPGRRTARGAAAPATIDVHAHFFNGSDVPVRGFVAECFGHNAPDYLQPLIKALAPLADKIAELAPTAFDELTALRQLTADTAGRAGPDLAGRVNAWFETQREAAVTRVVEVVRGSDFERRYREMHPVSERRGSVRIDEAEVRDVVMAPRSRDAVREAAAPQDVRVAAARAKLEFLFYMMALRAENLRAYIEAYAGDTDPAGVDVVLASLVDFDYWLDCPPRSSHEDQIALHAQLSTLHGGFMRPVVAYNPWTDIEQDGAALKRVLKAWTDKAAVAVKIYPPTGFMPAGNAAIPVETSKRRPDLKRLDTALRTFFETCANENIPVIAHAAHSNGRDNVHDEFSGPVVWSRLLCEMAADGGPTPIVNLGHFGGDNSSISWTRQFASLMKSIPGARLFADMGYWDTLLCSNPGDCTPTQRRLAEALEVRISANETVADRVMFATDWLMLSQVGGWREYPMRVRRALTAIAEASVVDRIMSLNARRCFARLAT